MAELWRIPTGPNGTMVTTTDFNLVREFIKRKKAERNAGLEVQTAALKPPVSPPKYCSVHAVTK